MQWCLLKSVVELWTAPLLSVMIQLNWTIFCVEEESLLEKQACQFWRFFFSLSLCNMHYELLPFNMKKRLPSTEFAAFRKVSLWYFRGPENVPWFTVEKKHFCVLPPPLLGSWGLVCTGFTAAVTSFHPSESLLYWEISPEFRFKIYVTNLCHSSESVNIHKWKSII